MNHPTITDGMIKEVITEFFESGLESSTGEARLLETALYIEDNFNIYLSDPEITFDNLETPEATRQLVEKKIKAGN